MIENLNHLLVFDRVAQAGSITGGAERLLISQPAVSKQLSQLQRHLGAKLFKRRGRGIQLTEAGIVVAGLARRIVSTAQSVEQSLADLSSLRTGRLQLGASTTISVYLLPELLVRFGQRFPGIRLRVETEGSEVLASRLLTGKIDLGLAEVHLADPGLTCSEFMKDELIPIVGARHPFARLKRIDPARFFKEPFIARDGSDRASTLLDSALATHRLSLKPMLSLPSTEAVKRAVAVGLGVAVVSRLAASAELAAGRLVRIDLPGISLKRSLYWASAANREESKAVTAFHCLLQHAARGTLPPIRSPRRLRGAR